MSKAIKTKFSQRSKRAVVHVLGCKVNQAEAAVMAHLLEMRGYAVDASFKDPDLVLVNTCCVTSRAESKSRRLIGKLTRTFPTAQLIVTGCLAEVSPCALDRFTGKLKILGTFDKDRFDQFLAGELLPGPESKQRGASYSSQFADLGVPDTLGRARTYLKVQDGCSQCCSYCVVPLARGPSRSLVLGRAISHAQALKEAGSAEIVLTGIHLGSYGRDLNPPLRLEDLLESVVQECSEVRFRMSSIEPQDITPRLIELAGSHPSICRHFHIPVQSGDDSVLKRMGRPYDAAFIRDLTARILRNIPEACVGFDLMVGFPGEDEDAFQKTLDLARDSGAAYLHVFPFSPRPGTPAASFGSRVPATVARHRVDELRMLSENLRKRFFERSVGKTFKVVLESGPDLITRSLVARTDNYIPVRVKTEMSPLTGKVFHVILEKIVGGEVLGIYV